MKKEKRGNSQRAPNSDNSDYCSVGEERISEPFNDVLLIRVMGENWAIRYFTLGSPSQKYRSRISDFLC